MLDPALPCPLPPHLPPLVSFLQSVPIAVSASDPRNPGSVFLFSHLSNSRYMIGPVPLCFDPAFLLHLPPRGNTTQYRTQTWSLCCSQPAPPYRTNRETHNYDSPSSKIQSHCSSTLPAYGGHSHPTGPITLVWTGRAGSLAHVPQTLILPGRGIASCGAHNYVTARSSRPLLPNISLASVTYIFVDLNRRGEHCPVVNQQGPGCRIGFSVLDPVSVHNSLAPVPSQHDVPCTRRHQREG